MNKVIRAAVAAMALTTAVGAVAGDSASATNWGTTEGCTPGYWKNHTDSWQEYVHPGRKVVNQFKSASLYDVWAKMTYIQALQGGGGQGVEGAVKILLRASVAAILNAAHEDIAYPLRRFVAYKLVERVDVALQSGDRQTMLDLAAYLDSANNLGCPLN